MYTSNLCILQIYEIMLFQIYIRNLIPMNFRNFMHEVAHKARKRAGRPGPEVFD